MTISVLNRYTSAVLATFPGSTLAGASFSGLNVSDADLSNQDLTNTVFTGCNLSGSTLENSILNGANFFRSNMEGCDLTNITSDTNSDFRCCHFQNVTYDAAFNYVYVAFQGGQSNDVSVSSGATTGLPDPSIPFYFNQIGTNTTGAFVSLQISPWTGDHGCEVVFGQEMRAFGYDILLVKLDRGATTMSDWVPTTADFLALQASFLDAIDEMKTLYPGRFFKFLGNWYLGEDDVRDIGAGAALYGKNYLLFQQGIERIVSQRMWKKFHIVLTQNWIASQKPNSFYSVRYFETLYAGWTLNIDDQPNIGDSVHLTAAGEDVLGHRRYLSVQEQIASE